MVLDRHRQPVGNGLVHRIAVDLVAKRLVGFGYRSAGKTYESSVWKRLAEHLCVWLRYHRPHVCVGIFAELDFLGMLKLDGATQEDVEASKKAMSSMDVIIGEPSRLERLATDIHDHYIAACANDPKRGQKEI